MTRPTPMPPRRGEVLACPFCDEVTQPNRLSDGTVVCSCPAARALPAEERALAPDQGAARARR